jgi:PDZ domain-containing protein
MEGSGAIVTEVVVGSPADRHLELADVIVAVDGEPVSFHDQAVSRVRQHKPGDVINFTVKRGDQEVPIAVEAGSDESGGARIGVVLATNDLKYKFPVKVDINTGLVGGPSAGLAFTLALLDELTPGELTGGQNVAVTGTIEYDGKVGVVGGVAQKAVTARKAGATVFLVPPAEVAMAQQHAGKMRIIGVDTLDVAIAELTKLGGSGLSLPETQQASPPS